MVAVALHALSSKPSYATSHGVLRRTPPPLLGSRFGFSTKFVVPLAPSPLRGEHLPLLRPLMAAGGSDRVYDSGNNQPEASETLKVFEWGRSLLSFVSSNFLPLALVGGIIFGLANPTLGCLAHKYSLSKFSTIGIFFLSGLMLRTAELGAAIEAWPAGLFGLGSILLLTPFFSRIILQIQLVPHEFVTGVAIFCCMPTTLSSGVALTMLARGNSALALAMTVISNLLGIMIVPLSLSMFIGAGAGVSVPTMPLFKSLVNTLLIPLILGKVVRETLKGVAEFADQNRRAFSMISAILLSLVPWIQVSRSRSLFLTVKPQAFAVAIAMGIILHLVLLALNAIAVQILSLVSGGRESVYAKKENARAVIVVASQKTLPVMVAVVEQLGGALGESGLLILPCVASHINQIIIDSFLVNWWLQKDQRHNEAKQV
ncbi:probable sodium/metabolite cotransporter BASS4, chloroplastic isoform X1 [Ananas comosus]|uniref:Probable sodium/metabolite cotransporter BASS4, chloroplastic n=1 Tax=Ananas comosus TaxID=4615 RepID=A0A6P5H1N1_ANACO|nr:probable sodium/metabolite cotransporter BASS4, chloroplastic isoform X1 [Ananas comosus]XP_020111814.1 probable sodium/metabolite cotransporter BASS4, chloroplastic isoform X1 [Ananas comosus]